MKRIYSFWRFALLAVLCVALHLSTVAPPATAAGNPAQGQGSDYVLGVGDKLRITVFGEDDLSGEFSISSIGTISMPLIGEVQAAGKTLSDIRSTITQKLSDGYMKNPKVSIEVQGYRPFFIVGEVLKPGSYNYVNGMRVINAVALAGGYTYRADKTDIRLRHAAAGSQEEHAQEDTTVQPGDVITITERFF
jgi:polysaccharide export outer membrane protein